jgi:Flp pilus assembly protein TadG
MKTTSHLPRSRARKNQRGAAMTETIIAVPVFIVLLAGMLFFHQMVSKTQRAMLAARREAWTSAMGGCPSGPVVSQPDLSSFMPNAPGSLVTLQAKVGAAPGSASDTARVSVLAAAAGPVAQGQGLDFSANISSRAIVTCNTKAERGDLPGVLKWFYGRASDMWSAIFSR